MRPADRWLAGCATGYLTWLAARAGLARRSILAGPRSPGTATGGPGQEEAAAPVTILQPILSGDPDLTAALADNLAALRHARFAWLVDHDDPAGVAAARTAAGDDPRVRILTCDAAPEGVNPKSYKLAAAVRVLDPLAEHPGSVLVVLDDDTRLPADSLAALLAGLEDRDLATGVPFYLPSAGVSSRLVEQLVNSSSVLTYLALARLGEPRSINGMTYALRAATLRAMGGFEAIEGTLIDDLAVAARLHESGGRIAQVPAPQLVRTTIDGPGHYVALMHRWMLFARLLLERETSAGRAMVLGVLGPPAPLLAATIALGARRPVVLAAILTVRHTVIARLNTRVSGAARLHPVLSPVAELLQPLHMAHALVRRTIRWRSRRYVVRGIDDFGPVPG